MSNWFPVAEIATKVQSGGLKAVDLVEQSLKAIDDKREYNAVISTMAERARARAVLIDERVARGEKIGVLAGVPFIAKDNFLTFGGDTTAASNILRGFEAPYQAEAIERLEAAGAICVGKANLDSFGHGGSTENSDFGVTFNPHDTTRVAGGSSGGSAASVVLDIVPFALGTDTGGSSREPAAFAGCVGFKPTYGLISRWGVIAMASSTDTVGILASSTEDVAHVLDVLAAPDTKDSTTIPRQTSYLPQNVKQPATKLRVGLIKEFMSAGLSDEVRAGVERMIEKVRQSGAEVTEVSIPSINLALACYYIIVPAEISSNLSRYDGQRYGYSASGVDSIDESFSKTRGLGFNAENKRRIMIGTYVLSSGYYDAYYKKAAKLRTKLINEFKTVFEKVDVLAGPTVPMTAFKIGENSADPLQMYLADIMTVAVNLVGVPAVSIPCIDTKGLPVGFQLIGRQREDAELLEFAHRLKGGSQ